MGKKGKTIKKNQIKISKKCKDLNQLKQLKINDEPLSKLIPQPKSWNVCIMKSLWSVDSAFLVIMRKSSTKGVYLRSGLLKGKIGVYFK